MDKDKLAVQEDDKLELTNLSRNCILHALEALPKAASTANILSDLDKIRHFCQDISEIVHSKSNMYKKKSVQRGIPEMEELPIESKVVDQFYNGVTSANDFLMQIEEKLNETLTGNFDHNALFRACWQVYCAERNPHFTLSQCFCDESVYYHLWLVFNAVLPPESDLLLIPVKSLSVVMKRMLDLCAHEPISYDYSGKKVALNYQEYLQAIVTYTEPLKLQPLLIQEVRLQSRNLM